MAWNKAMRVWASEGPKKAARREGGRLVRAIRTVGCDDYDMRIQIVCAEADADFAERLTSAAAEEIMMENRRRCHHGEMQISYEAICESRE